MPSTRKPSSASTIFRARRVLAPEGVIEGAGVWVERGLVREIVRSASAQKRAVSHHGAQRVDLGDGLIAPSYVDAHAHLELTGVGFLPREGPFAAWIAALIQARSSKTAGDLVRDARAGAERLLASGTTVVGDIDSSRAIETAARGLPLRVRRFFEVLDAGDRARARGAIERWRAHSVRRANFFEGVSPHAPYTVSAELWTALGARLGSTRARVAIHLAETPDEVEWLEHGTGSLSALLKHSPRQSGLASIEAAGLLGPRTALVHGNCLARGERARIAGSGSVLVHCPGTHAFFGRERFDAEGWLAAGVPIALGTDSRASNDDLDMAREMALFRAAHPSISPEVVFAGATRTAARALGFEGRAGELTAGAWADFCLHEDVDGARPNVLEALTRAETRLGGVWVGGRRILGGAAAPA
jgi:aminodeoxyfutalosine deaminase